MIDSARLFWGGGSSHHFASFLCLFCVIGCCFGMSSCHFTVFYIVLRQMATHRIALHQLLLCFFFCYLDRLFIHLLIICDFFIYKINFAPSPQHSHRISFGECFPPPPLINPSLILNIQYDISRSNIEISELWMLYTIPVNLVVPQKLGYPKSHMVI